MRLSVNEAKLTGLLARNCATIQLVLILKFTIGPYTFSAFSRNRPLITDFPLPIDGIRCNAPAKPTFVPQDTAKIKPHLNFTKEIRIYT